MDDIENLITKLEQYRAAIIKNVMEGGATEDQAEKAITSAVRYFRENPSMATRLIAYIAERGYPTGNPYDEGIKAIMSLEMPFDEVMALGRGEY